MRSRFNLVLCFSLMCLAGSAASAPGTAFENQCRKLAEAKEEDASRFHELLKIDWDYAMHESPETATEVGYPGLDDRWTDMSFAAIERRRKELHAPLAALKTIERSKLSPDDQLNYDLFKRNHEEALEGSRFPEELMPVNQLQGVQQDCARLLELAPHRNRNDYENILKRMERLPELVDQTMALMRKGQESGITPPRITLRDVAQQIQNQTEPDPQKNSMLEVFRDFPPGLGEAERLELRQRAETILRDQIRPAMQRFHEFFVKTYYPKTRESIALSDLPNGPDWYAFRVKASTTTRLSPKEIHALGLSEVKRIRAAMDRVIEETGFKGSFAEFSAMLRTDAKFYFKDADALLRAYRDIAKRADPELAHLFGRLPRLTYGVKAVPAYAEKSQTTAYYQPGSPAAGRPGYFYANTYALDTRPSWEMEALTLHEAVPGHHLQIAIAQELADVPEFRKNGGYTAFVEGWGLYAESLGDEMGFYKDPYHKFGQLTYEMWRAIRLVVDTGIHSMGWSRRQAIDYFMSNSSKTEHDITVEIDRYIVWPGQALAYKIGELKFKELRALAVEELGDRFDIREFHDQLLDSGALPLEIVEARVKEWLSHKARSEPSADAGQPLLRGAH